VPLIRRHTTPWREPVKRKALDHFAVGIAWLIRWQTKDGPDLSGPSFPRNSTPSQAIAFSAFKALTLILVEAGFAFTSMSSPGLKRFGRRFGMASVRLDIRHRSVYPADA
jgi:hypothetical protein